VRGDETDPLLPENSAGSDCPLAGPAYPAPSQRSESAVFRDAVYNLNIKLADPSSALKMNATAWAVALFSAKENKTLYEQYYTPSVNVSVREVNIDSIFRLASMTKVFTVWTFLAMLGDGRFNDPITKYIPELSVQCRDDVDYLYNDIDHVRWEDVTVGELASQSSGITRDGTTQLYQTMKSRELIFFQSQLT
jgi:CubicO group peptidase (beta-lactamase class C family)